MPQNTLTIIMVSIFLENIWMVNDVDDYFQYYLLKVSNPWYWQYFSF